MRAKVILILFFAVLVAFFSENGLTQGDVVRLPKPRYEGKVSVEQAIFKRKSIRSFTGAPLTLEEVSQLLWAAGGQTVDGVTGPTRSYPSAGASYPLEIFLVAGNVTGLEAGIYRYNWRENSLTLLRRGDLRNELRKAARGQYMVGEAPVTIVITADYDKTTRRYGERGRSMYVPMDAGHLGQNVHLQAEGLGLGTVMIGAFKDREVAGVLGTEKETPVYMMPVGRPR
ncbi:MAG: SagB/ThcOx family dehydrogenase [Candidatus Omnitrophota bacterium]